MVQCEPLAEPTHAVRKDHDATRAHRPAGGWVRENALEHSGVELDDSLREVVEAAKLVRLGARRQLLQCLELALSL